MLGCNEPGTVDVCGQFRHQDQHLLHIGERFLVELRFFTPYQLRADRAAIFALFDLQLCGDGLAHMGDDADHRAGVLADALEDRHCVIHRVVI